MSLYVGDRLVCRFGRTSKPVENLNKHIQKRIVSQVGHSIVLYRDARLIEHKICNKFLIEEHSQLFTLYRVQHGGI